MSYNENIPLPLRAFAHRLNRQIGVPHDVMDPLSSVPHTVAALARGENLSCEGDPQRSIHFVSEGWLIGYVGLPDGKRYIHRIYQAGDVIGIEDTNWSYATCTVEAITDCSLAQFHKDDQPDLFAFGTPLGAMLYGMVMSDHVVVVDTAKANSCLKGPARIAHLMLTIEARQRLTSQTRSNRFDLPLRQAQIADATGLSLVHTNKSIVALRESGRLRIWGNLCDILDRRSLLARTGFVDRYVSETATATARVAVSR